MGNVPGVSRVGPPRDQGLSVQVHATWPSSAPVRPFIANTEFPRRMEAFVSRDEWSAIVGGVECAVHVGHPGACVTAANYGLLSGLLLILGGLVVGVPQYFVSCTLNGTPTNSADCERSKTVEALTVSCLCVALWLGCVKMPRLSTKWCARAAEELRTGLTDMRSVAPKLDFQLENASTLNFSIHISPTATALRQQALEDKLVHVRHHHTLITQRTHLQTDLATAMILVNYLSVALFALTRLQEKNSKRRTRKFGSRDRRTAMTRHHAQAAQRKKV